MTSFIILFFASFFTYGQSVYLVKNKDTVYIRKGFIGVSNQNANFKYKEFDELSYVIEVFNKDTLLLKRPIKYYDTIVSFEQYSLPYIEKDFRFVKSFRENGKRMAKISIIEQYQYDFFNPSQLKTISYPPKSDNQVGCIFCIFMPVYNIFYIKNTRKYYIPNTYKLSEWKLIFE